MRVKAGIHLVLPMAGSGTRFKMAGYPALKPLIPVDGLPMYRKALSSALPEGIVKQTFILPSGGERDALAEEVRSSFPDAQAEILPAPTRGPAETCLAVADGLDEELGVLVMDCDLWFRSASYSALLAASLRGDAQAEGAVVMFKSRDPRYSFAEVERDRVIRTAEKAAISDNALIGAYFFRDSGVFRNALHRSLAGGGNPTRSIAPIYNQLIEDGRPVLWAMCDEYHSFGTPEELGSYLQFRKASG